MSTPNPGAGAPPFIPVNVPIIGKREKELVMEALETGWISSEGPFVTRFEQQMAARVGRKHGISVSNGTAALEVALRALKLGPGDEVIMPAFTIISCAQAITYTGATPVLVDADPHTWNMVPEQVEAAVTPRTKAILVVHIYGLPVDMDPILKTASRHGLAVVEDAAEVIGQTYRGRPCGSFGDISTFSFYANKHITTGEGGMIFADDQALADRCRSLKNLCFLPERRFVHHEIGWNYRLTNLQAALGIGQLERLDETTARKREMGRLYSEALAGIDGLTLPVNSTGYADNVFWVYGLVLDPERGVDATAFAKKLQTCGVGTRPFFWPIHEQPVYLAQGLFKGSSHPVAERLARYGFYLPSGVAIEPPEIERAADAVRRCLVA